MRHFSPSQHSSLLGTSKDITLGPTAIMSMLVARYCMRPDSWPIESPPLESSSDPNLAINLTFLTGVILVALGLFNLGFLVNFISHAIIVGFCSAAAIVIAGIGFDTQDQHHYHHHVNQLTRGMISIKPDFSKSIAIEKTIWH